MIPSAITSVDSVISEIVRPKLLIVFIKSFTAPSIASNLFFASLIRIFCCSSELTELLMLVVTLCTSLVKSLRIKAIFSVAVLVCSDKVRISSATTANPLPASPALAASIEAFKARRFV